MGSITKFATNFLALDDVNETSFAGEAGNIPQVNPGETALEFWDILNSANSWTATQTIGLGGDIATANHGDGNIGTVANRFNNIVGGRGVFVGGTSGNITLPANVSHGGIIGGTSTGNGTKNHTLNGTYPAVGCLATVFAGPGATARAQATRGGAFIGGSAYSSTAGVAEIIASGYGSIVLGYSFSPGTSGASTTRLASSGPGCIVLGYAHGRRGACTLEASGNGSIAMGKSRANAVGSSANMTSSGKGSILAGYAFGGGAFLASMTSSGNGSIVLGYSKAVTAASMIQATADGAIALGFTDSGTISAQASNCIQAGVGTNAEADTFSMGTMLRFKGTDGAPGTPRDGDMWIDTGVLNFRSNGNTMAIDQTAAWTVTNPVTDRAFDTTTVTLQNLAEVVGTIVADLQTMNLFG